MKTMLVSEFKAKCIATLKEVYRSREPMVVTLRGKPIVTIQPFAEFPPGKHLGELKGKMAIHGDIVHMDSTGDWDIKPTLGERLKDLERSGSLVRSALPRKPFGPVGRRLGALSRFLAERGE